MVLDGAMGTMIQNQNLDEADYKGKLYENHDIDLKGNNDVLSLKPNDYTALKNLSNCYYNEQLFENAIVSLKLYLKENVGDADYRNLLGHAYFNLDMYQKAIDTYKMVSNLEPEYIDINYTTESEQGGVMDTPHFIVICCFVLFDTKTQSLKQILFPLTISTQSSYPP